VPDVLVRNNGSMFTCTLLTKSAQAWVKENVELEGWAWLGKATFAVEHGYIQGLVAGMQDAGLNVR
jgi:hypothetical protein